MTVLVLGAGGQLGRCLKEESLNHPELSFLFKNSTELDITNKKSIETVFSEHNIQYCINCAAYTGVDKAEEEQAVAFLVNAEAVKNLALVCKTHHTVLIHISTDFVFDGNKSIPYIESDIPNPLNVYGASKLKGEEYITTTLKSFFIIRTSWLYSEFGNNFMKTMIRLAQEKRELNIVSDQFGTPTYARDLAQTLLQIIFFNKKDFGIYHYSNEGVVSWYDFAKEIFNLFKIEIKVNGISTNEYPTPASRPRYSVLSNKKIVKTLGIQSVNWKDSLQIAVSNYKTL